MEAAKAKLSRSSVNGLSWGQAKIQLWQDQSPQHAVPGLELPWAGTGVTPPASPAALHKDVGHLLGLVFGKKSQQTGRNHLLER